MIAADVFAVYIATVFVVMITPGPSTMIGFTHGMTYGWRRAVFTAFGDISANFLQMGLAVAGLGLILSQSAIAFTLLKFAGAGYLAYLGIKLLRSAPPNLATPSIGTLRETRSAAWHYQQGFIVAGTSPKAILFYGALFPQFIDPALPLLFQFILLAGTCMLIDFCIVVGYAYTADRSGAALARRGGLLWINRIGGGMMLGAAGLLASSHK